MTYETCNECGAAMAEPAAHRSWHIGQRRFVSDVNEYARNMADAVDGIRQIQDLDRHGA